MSFLIEALKRAAAEAELAISRATSARQALRLKAMAAQMLATANSLEKEVN